MENLNKENFWNELFTKYPKGVQVFCDWIDEYKKRNHWDRLFNGGYEMESPKFHDLPIAMQKGILIEFISYYPKDEITWYSLQKISNDAAWTDALRRFFIHLDVSDKIREKFIANLKTTEPANGR